MMAAFILLKPVIVGVFARELAISKDIIAADGVPQSQPAVPVPVVSPSAE